MGELQSMYSGEDLIAVLILCGCAQAHSEQEMMEQNKREEQNKNKLD